MDTPTTATAAEGDSARRIRRTLGLVWTLVAFVALGSLILFGLVVVVARRAILLQGATSAAATKSAESGSPLTADWKARIAKDYPDWKMVDFEVFDVSGSYGTRTYHRATLIPSGWSTAVQVDYVSKNGGMAISEDEVLRSDGDFHMWSGSLLDYLKRYYVGEDKVLDTVSTDSDGYVTVEWHDPQDAGGPSALMYDILVHDPDSKSWELEQ